MSAKKTFAQKRQKLAELSTAAEAKWRLGLGFLLARQALMLDNSEEMLGVEHTGHRPQEAMPHQLAM